MRSHGDARCRRGEPGCVCHHRPALRRSWPSGGVINPLASPHSLVHSLALDPAGLPSLYRGMRAHRWPATHERMCRVNLSRAPPLFQGGSLRACVRPFPPPGLVSSRFDSPTPGVARSRRPCRRPRARSRPPLPLDARSPAPLDRRRRAGRAPPVGRRSAPTAAAPPPALRLLLRPQLRPPGRPHLRRRWHGARRATGPVRRDRRRAGAARVRCRSDRRTRLAMAP